MKTKFIFSLLASLPFAASAQAGPFLYADPYPPTSVQPDAASLTINGGTPISCTLVSVAGGLQPKCDLASITTDGTYTLIMTVSKAASIATSPGGATNTAGGSASSAPFSYRLLRAPVATPALRVGP